MHRLIAPIAMTLAASVACLAADPPAKPTLHVTDAKSGITVEVKDDHKSLVAKDANGKKLWEVDVIAKAPKGIGQQAVRHLSIEKGNVRAIYGKHSYADFDLKSGKLTGSGSD